MRYLFFSETEKQAYPVCLLVPTISREEIRKAYIDTSGKLAADDVLVVTLHQAEGKKKTPAAEIKCYIEEELVPVFNDTGTQYIVVADSDYFKILTKTTKAEANLGYVMDCAYGPWKVVYVPNYRQIFYDPDRTRAKIAQGITALTDHMGDSYKAPGCDIIRFAAYPQSDDEIEAWLEKLHQYPSLTADVETFSLKHHSAGIGTITFCWNQHEGIAFPVDYVPIPGATSAPFGKQVANPRIYQALRRFFETYKGNLKWHSIGFDVYIAVYVLFMKDILDTEGLLTGLEVMLRDWDCTKLITYLATNSCAGNKLGLKENAQEFSGNWAKDTIEDITTIPLENLLQYNIVDGISTWYVFNKYWDKLVADDQEQIYRTLFQPAMHDIIQMQLTGLPLNMKRVKEVRAILEADQKVALDAIQTSQIVQAYTYNLNEKWVAKRNSELKVKRVTLADAKEEFNPNSGPQLQDLLYGVLNLPVIALTDSKQPATGGKTLKALKNHTRDPDVIAFLDAMVDYKAVNKILNDFIPSMENAAQGPDGWHYLFGNFNLGGTLSGRLSSSGPNLQNLPATGSRYAKIIKSCFEAPPGWLLVGLDFDSLEDKISALTTKDPNKLKVYTDGFDGHCLRAYAYFGSVMQDIDPTSVVSINSIAKKYPEERQKSKVPTFLLTYGGTFKGMMEQCGFTVTEAKDIETRYHDLYAVSDAWVKNLVDQACDTGYVTVAFGLRVRTPLLKQVIRGTSKTPYEAEAEGRSAGNALGQSWCLLNTRAWIEFMGKVRKSRFRLDIRPAAQIHDAGYAMVRNDTEAVLYTNEHLVKAVEWQEDPLIKHDQVKLSGGLSIFNPSWVEEYHVPKGASENELLAAIADQYAKKMELKKAA